MIATPDLTVGAEGVVIESLAARLGLASVSGVSLAWGPGVHAVMGSRDDGGPLLLSVVAGTVRPRAGAVRVFGEDPRASHVRARIAHVPLDAALPDALRVDEALAVAASLRGEPTGNAEARLATLGVETLARRPIESLTRPEARAVALAEGLSSTRVGALLVEEPLVSVDPRAAGRLAGALRARAAAGVVVVVATASVGDGLELAEEHVLFRRGAVVRSGSAADCLVGFWQGGNHARVRVVLRRVDDDAALAAALAGHPDVVAVERVAGAICARGPDPAALARAPGRAAIEAGVDVTELRFDPPSLDEARARVPPSGSVLR